MDIQSLIEKQHFCQYKVTLQPEELIQEEAAQVWRTFYILTGAGIIKTSTHRHVVHCGSFISLEPNIPYTMTNTGLTLFTALLTQAV